MNEDRAPAYSRLVAEVSFCGTRKEFGERIGDGEAGRQKEEDGEMPWY